MKSASECDEFRGKTLDGQWVYGDFLHGPLDKTFIVSKCEMDSTLTQIIPSEYFEVLPDSVGRFTGRYWRQHAVYSGDIFDMRYRKTGKPEYAYVSFSQSGGFHLFYANRSFSQSPFIGHLNLETLELVGNLTDNANLFTGQQKE